MLNAKIFGAYDVRGIYPSELDEEGAHAIGQAFVEVFKPKRIAVGHDMRVSSPAMAEAATLGASEAERSVARANQRVVDDWLEAIMRNRQPICSGYAGLKALEMALAVFAAGLSRGRVELPLKARNHPLAL